MHRQGKVAAIGLLSLFLVCLSMPLRALAGGVVVGGTVTGARGQQVAFDVTLQTGGAQVVGGQNDITFDGINIRIPAAANGKPDCAVNGEIDKGATSFFYRGATGCSGPACGGIRALVISTGNVTPIADGSVLYTCKVNIAAGAADGQYPLSLSGITLSDPDGQAIPSSGINGKIIVSSGFTPTPTPTRTPTKTPPPTRTAIPQVSLNVGSTAGARGQQPTFNVTLQTGGAHVVGTQNDISFDSGNIPIASTGTGRPDCAVNPDIGKEATSFVFEPRGCSGTACTSVRALVISVLNTDSIPDGLLYTCRVNIAANAPFVTYPLSVSRIAVSDHSGNPIAATGTNGSITVDRFGPTLTPTPTASPPRAIIAFGSAMAPPGNQQAEFGVFLYTMGSEVAAAQVDIIFDASTPVGANADGSPRCTLNPNIHKGGTSFHFQPANCVPGINCGSVRAIVIAFDNTDPILDGVTLFTCTDAIKRTALTQQYVLMCSGAQATDSSAHRVPAACTNGVITVTTPCVGDCNGDGEITIDELLTGVGIGLGGIPFDQCPAFDADRNQSLTIDELLQGVIDALDGCPVSQ